MSTIRTPEQRDEVPIGAVVQSSAGTIACRFDATRGVVFGDDRPFPWSALALPAETLHPEPQLQVQAALGENLENATLNPYSQEKFRVADDEREAIARLLAESNRTPWDFDPEQVDSPYFRDADALIAAGQGLRQVPDVEAIAQEIVGPDATWDEQDRVRALLAQVASEAAERALSDAIAALEGAGWEPVRTFLADRLASE